MKGSLIQLLGSQPLMQIIRSLYLSPEERHLRDLANQYSLSPGGVSDIVRRLKESGILTEKRIKNRRCFSLALSKDEFRCLEVFFSVYENTLIAERAEEFSRGAADKLQWMDEAFDYYRGLKNRDLA